MISITRAAQDQIDDLFHFYLVEKDRPDAAERLLDDLTRARLLILDPSKRGGSFPRPNHELEALSQYHRATH